MEEKGLKLSYKKVIFAGFAFMLISAFWSAYDNIIPLLLVNKFGLSQASSGFVMSLDNIFAVIMLPFFGALSDKTNTKYGKRTPYVVLGTIVAVIAFITLSQTDSLVMFIIILLITLIAMSTFRSPAVALMPDITVKPLRSKGNAVINLMGSVGGILALGLGIIFKTSAEGKTDFTIYILSICLVMLISLVLYVFLCKETKWAKQMEQDSLELADDKDQQVEGDGKLSKSQVNSLLLILFSVFLWFMGYNAIISKYSLYATNVLEKDFNTTLIIAQITAIIAYLPLGMLSTKIGRKKAIMIGVVLLALAFGLAIFATKDTPLLIINLLFGLAGIAWAMINVNSFPMVVELATGSTIGKYTGFYYTASMSAQIVTPILSGAIMTYLFNDSLSPLFPYGTIFVALALITMYFVKHGDSKKIK